MENKINLENIADIIYFIRGQKVMLDFDLATLYSVPTKALKQAVRRNLERFPADFMFELNDKEIRELRSQIVTATHRTYNRSTPWAFTEQGVAMLSSVLKSKRAIEVNIAIMRTFIEMRHFLSKNAELAKKLADLEKTSNLKYLQYDQQFELIMEIIQEMRQDDNEENDRKIGFDTTI